MKPGGASPRAGGAASPAAPAPSPRPGLRWLPLLAGAVAVVPFLPALDGEFLRWDDDVNFLGNPHFRGLGWTHIWWMFTSTLLGHWIPLTWLTLGVNYMLGGMDPWGYHLGNLLLHAANAALVYLVARRLLAAGLAQPLRHPALALGALTAALAFAVHPLRAESVAWITQRRDVLCTCFYLLAVLAYLRATASSVGPRRWWLIASLGAFGAALLSKAMAMTLPLTLLLLDAYPLRRWDLGWRRILREKLPYLALAGAGAVGAVLAVSRGAGWTAYGEYGGGARVAMVAYSLWFYPSKLVWPDALSPLYELPSRVDPLAWRFAGPIAGFVVVTALLVGLSRRFPAGLAAWTQSAIVLAPVCGLVHAGNQLAHDRYSYLSGLGFAVLMGAGVSWTVLARQRGRLRAWVVVAILGTTGLAVIGWGAGAWRQTHIWLDSEALWRGSVAADPECAICHANLGAALMEARPSSAAKLDEGEAHLRESIRLGPRFPAAYLANLGRLLVIRGRSAEALIPLRHAVGLDPGNVLAHYWLVQAYRFTSQHELAEAEIAVLARLDPARAAEFRTRQ